MARLDQVDDASPSVEVSSKPKSRSSAGGHSEAKGADNAYEASAEDNRNDKDDEEEEGGEEEGDEEEYEIEKVLEAKRGVFRKGEQTYLVKWKGYGEESNSWVSERDAGNAQELINEFLREKAKEKAQNAKLSARGQKSTSVKSSKGTKGTTPDGESASVSITKRGRKKAAESSDEDEEDTSRKTKKSRGAAIYGKVGSGKRGPLASLDRTDDEDVPRMDTNGFIHDEREYVTMKDLKLGTMKSWEEHVKQVTTVARRPDGSGMVIYFETTDGQSVCEPSSTCAKRFPQKLIQFYESKLKWTEENAEES